jgi:hypothetical protein
MSKHWQQRGGWLSPQAYEALSPGEKRQLWRERKVARAVKPRFKSGRARGGMGLGPWLAAAIVAGLGIGAYGVPQSSLVSPASVPVTASPSTGSGPAFGLCHTGGGTNCVVDGDTFYIGGAKVRIAGIDTPETHPPRCAHEARLGEEATRKLRELLNSGAVTMTSIERDRDRYGRLLRNVAVDGADVGRALVAAGVAREYGSGRRAWC